MAGQPISATAGSAKPVFHGVLRHRTESERFSCDDRTQFITLKLASLENRTV